MKKTTKTTKPDLRCGNCGCELFRLRMGELGESVIVECGACGDKTRIVGWEAGIPEAGTFHYSVQLRRHTGKKLKTWAR